MAHHIIARATLTAQISPSSFPTFPPHTVSSLPFPPQTLLFFYTLPLFQLCNLGSLRLLPLGNVVSARGENGGEVGYGVGFERGVHSRVDAGFRDGVSRVGELIEEC